MEVQNQVWRYTMRRYEFYGRGTGGSIGFLNLTLNIDSRAADFPRTLSHWHVLIAGILQPDDERDTKSSDLDEQALEVVFRQLQRGVHCVENPEGRRLRVLSQLDF
jgi:hypothetical protein